MQVTLLGTAAGGGFPQWNCRCPGCETARAQPARARPRTQSSAAVSADGRRWFLLGASPDVRDQLARLPWPAEAGVRALPVEGVVLTDAELDHSLGLLLMREGRRLAVHATAATLDVLERGSHILPTLRAFAAVEPRELPLDAPVPLRLADGAPSGLEVEAFAVPGDPPRFARGHAAPGHTVGLLVRETAGGATLAFVPGCGEITAAVRERLTRADAILFDGTCWRDDELPSLGISNTTARAMGHVPISGPDGSLEALAPLHGVRRIYTHLNNTNPVLIEDSPERRAVERAGLEIGRDGLHLAVERLGSGPDRSAARS